MGEHIGFIGLGNIGKPIADNIARGGYALSVYDVPRTKERAPDGAVDALGPSVQVEEGAAAMLEYLLDLSQQITTRAARALMDGLKTKPSYRGSRILTWEISCATSIKTPVG